MVGLMDLPYKTDSPARNGGCGLKPKDDRDITLQDGFTRQKWRVWIETAPLVVCCPSWAYSPARNGGCGLKQDMAQLFGLMVLVFTRQKWRVWIETLIGPAPCLPMNIHPPEMAGVD